ncbi:hypothetical protein GCM10020295_36820 [Streptomyces cinereospinus]
MPDSACGEDLGDGPVRCGQIGGEPVEFVCEGRVAGEKGAGGGDQPPVTAAPYGRGAGEALGGAEGGKTLAYAET